MLLRLVPEEAGPAGAEGTCAVLAATVVGPVHLETLGQACAASPGSGEVRILGPHPAHETNPAGLSVTRLLLPPALPCPSSSPGRSRPGISRAKAEQGRTDTRARSGPALTWVLQAPSPGSAWWEQEEVEEEEEAPQDPGSHRPDPPEVTRFALGLCHPRGSPRRGRGRGFGASGLVSLEGAPCWGPSEKLPEHSVYLDFWISAFGGGSPALSLGGLGS